MFYYVIFTLFSSDLLVSTSCKSFFRLVDWLAQQIAMENRLEFSFISLHRSHCYVWFVVGLSRMLESVRILKEFELYWIKIEESFSLREVKLVLDSRNN